MRKLWKGILYWFEHGDLVPLIVVVSAVHYTVILEGVDWLPVAIAIGLLVDLGHYRWVRAAVRYRGVNVRHLIARWGMAVFMTIVSVAYQQRFYADLWLSLPLPLLIISLAWLSDVDKTAGTRKESEPKPAEREVEPIASGYYCEDCGQTFASQNALNAHGRKHATVSENGHKKERVPA